MGGRSTIRRTVGATGRVFAVVAALVATQMLWALPANAAAAANLDACGNGTVAVPLTCSSASNPTGWQNGDINANSGHYKEGDSVPYRALVTGLARLNAQNLPIVHTLDIDYDTLASAHHAFDYLTTYNRTVTTANPCDGQSAVSPCSGPTQLAIPHDPTLPNNITQVAGSMSIWNGSITDVSYVGAPSGNDLTRTIRVSFTIGSNDCVGNDCDGIIAWGGHIASELDWGAGSGAGGINGASYHMDINALDGTGGKQSKSVQAAAVVPPPTMATQVSTATPAVGAPVTDTATLSGTNGVPSGTVTFFLCGPSATPPDCSTGGTQVGNPVAVTPSGTNSGTATSASTTPTVAGNYCFRIVYTPDAAAQYSPGSHTNLTTECFNAATPTLTLTKAADAGSVSAGTAIGYTLTVTNTSSTSAFNVVLTDTLPTNGGLAWTVNPASAACNIANGVLTCNFGTIAGNGSASVHISSPTTSATCGSAVSNTASVTSSNGGSATSGAPTTITVNCPNLSVTKVADAGSVSAGSDIGYTITVTNSGAGAATGVTLTDSLPANSGLTWAESPDNPNCGISNGVLTCNFGTLAANGGSASVHISSPTTSGTCGTVSNSASATSTNGGSANSGTATAITVNCPSLSVTKVADASSVSAGTAIGYTITVANTGAGLATGVTLTDTLPANNGLTWAESPDNPNCGISNGVLTCNSGTLAGGGASASVHISSPTTSGTCGTVSNTASATSTNGGSANSGTATAIAVNCPSLSVTKVADAGSVSAGTAIGYTITVTNNGAGSATSVTLTDTLPANNGLTWAESPDNPNCGISNGVLTCNFGTLAGGGASASVHISSPTTSGTCGTVSNTASATSTNGGSANSGTATAIAVNCPSLSVAKTADASSVSAGTAIGYLITVTNNGPGTATGVTLSDTLPANSGLSWTENSNNCSIANGALSCSFGTLGSGASASVHIDSPTTSATCGTVANSALANATNVAQGASVGPVSITVNCPNLIVTKTADAASASAGTAIGYTITVTNNGTGAATGVMLTDTLPTNGGLTWTESPDNPNCNIGSGVLTCNFGTLAGGGASASVHISSPTSAATCAQPVSNTASATATNLAAPVFTAAPVVITVNCPNVVITKVADATSASAGDTIGYTITVTNNGAGAADTVTVTDTLPTNAGLSWTESPDNPNCAIANGVLTCNFGTVAGNGGSVSVHISSPTTAATCGTVNNTASVTETNGSPAQASAPITVNCPNLVITKVADNANVTAPNPIGYTITVTNNGAGAATGVTLSDTLPNNAGLSWTINPSNQNCNIANGVLGCSFGTLAANGGSASVHITSPTTTATCGGNVVNTATAGATNALATVTSTASTIAVACPAFCRPDFTPTTTLTGVIPNNVTVSGNTVIQNADIRGSVTVNAGANVFIVNSKFASTINSTNAASFEMFGSSVQSGALTIRGTTGRVWVGNTGNDPSGNQGTCTGNLLQHVEISGSKGGVRFINNTLSGSLTVANNKAPQSDYITLIKLNKIAGTINCSGNLPPASNGGGANTVQGTRSGECSSPTF
jgi:uncharacterized repeat protein (TIGR01451 family)